MTPRVDAAAKALDTEQAPDIHTNPDGANVIEISEEEFAVGRPPKKKPEESAEEFYRRTTAKGKLDAGRTVRSGLAFDFDSTAPVVPWERSKLSADEWLSPRCN